MLRTTVRRVAAAAVAVIGAAGAAASCGLVNPNIATLSFDLPAETYSFDTSDPAWKSPPSNFPQVTCGAGGQVADCCNPPAPAPAVDCTATPLVCASGVCALSFIVTRSQSVNLQAEVPVLASHQSLANVTISKIHYAEASTLTVPLPSVDIFVAPASVTSADDPSAKKLGTIPGAPAMATIAGDVPLDPDGQAALAGFAQNPGTPFNFITRTTVIVPSGSPTPQGKADITITGQLSATPAL
jgi:hypothetical protein